MKSRIIRKPCEIIRLLLCLVMLGQTGCSSPPSVAPLLSAVDRAITAERQYVSQDDQRQQALLEQQRQSLHSAFKADLTERKELHSDWVAKHVRVYVAAHQALTEQHHRIQQAYRTRLDNLQAASRAQQRAIALIEQQDHLLQAVPDLRRWLVQQQSSTPEN